MARDIGGSDPERMSAENTAKYVAEVFQGTSIKVYKLHRMPCHE